MRPGAVTFDAGGTLFAVAEPVGRTYARVAARHGIRVAADEVERRFRAAFASAPPLAFPGASPARLADHERAWWNVVVRGALGPADPAALEAAFAELFAHYARGGAWRVFPEVPDALAGMRARGARIGVVSNFDARLGPLLAELGLAPLVDVTVFSTRAGAAKPDAAVFHAALGALRVPAAAAVHVGDGVREDVDGARGAGLRAVLVARTGPAPAVGVPVIASLAELPAAVAALEG
jgi:putative hydrolase of the HAD superfamily